jgi:hypothetical protein
MNDHTSTLDIIPTLYDDPAPPAPCVCDALGYVDNDSCGSDDCGVDQ